jgi:barstar (barnase inhibitor)
MATQRADHPSLPGDRLKFPMPISDELLHESLLIIRHDARRLDEVQALIARTWTITHVDLRGVQEKQDLHQKFIETCQFPSWYGPSLDSLRDMLISLPEDLGHSRACLWIETQGLNERLLESMLCVLSSSIKVRYTRLLEPVETEDSSSFEDEWLGVVCVVDSKRTEQSGLSAEVRNYGGGMLIKSSVSPLLLLGHDDPGAGYCC